MVDARGGGVACGGRALANHARRMLRRTYDVFMMDWFSEAPPLDGIDPEDVRRDMDRRYPPPNVDQ
jgi:hypothetical protein